MLEIGADDLRFTFEEAFSLLKELKAPALSTKNVKALNDKAEGWAVGLKMAMLSMRGEKDIPGFVSGFTGTVPDCDHYHIRPGDNTDVSLDPDHHHVHPGDSSGTVTDSNHHRVRPGDNTGTAPDVDRTHRDGVRACFRRSYYRYRQ